MKLKLFSVILILLLIQSCCFKRVKEIGRESFTVEEKAKIPYADNQNIDFITNEDYQFSLNTRVNSSFSSDQYQCEDYISYEYYSVLLTSELPTLDIDLSLRRNYIESEEEDAYMINISVNINRQWFYYDEDEPLETIEINDITYTEVYRYLSGDTLNPISEVFFNEAFGILKINYTNGDYVQINS